MYHEINTRYNIYFNAEIAYEEALKQKSESYDENLSKRIYLYPYYEPNEKGEYQKLGSFETTIDKATKAIKIHSIQVKPERDPNKRGNIAYQKWLEQREFNPFLKNAWLLMAKAEYQSLDYLKALTTFSYITRLFKQDQDVVAEARLWMAKTYTQMGWFYEADNVFRQIELNGGVPNSQKKLFSSIYADYLIRNKKYEESIPYLQQAIKSEGGLQETRLKYLLGQIYAETGDKTKAYQAFSKVSGLGTPYKYTFNARIQEAQNLNINDPKEKKKVLSSLGKMAKQSKNKELLDQVYYTIGDVHMQAQDTAKAIENFALAIDKSTRGGYDKAIAQVRLGDIYFGQKEYVKAQPLYPEALGVLGNKYERYAELSLRSEVLSELVVYVEAVNLQDSLQTLAKMPEDKRLEVINKIIADLKKKREEEKKEAALAEHNSKIPEGPPLGSIIQQPNMPTMPGGSSFYFYNSQTVTQGKTSFRQLWGNRKLEDNWRRRNKTSAGFDDFFNQPDDMAQMPDSLGNMPEVSEKEAQDKDAISDDLKPEYYLRQIPFTTEALQASNDILEDAFYQMGLIYKNKLEDLNLSIEAFDSAIERFPKTENLEEIYYQLFLIYTQLGNKDMADVYRAKLIAEFPDRDYAIMLSDPNYDWNLRNLTTLENNLYQETYDAYMASKIESVRQNYGTVKEKYALSTLMPKFMFLNALTYAQTGESEEFKNSLRTLIDKYPNADVTPLATEMLRGVIEGRALVGGGPARGMIWNMQFGGADILDNDSTTTFADKPDVEHQMLVIFDPVKVNRNTLLYNVADYNFSNFILQTFDLSFSEMKPYEILQVKGFGSFSDIAEYVDKAFEDSSLVSQIDSSVILVPISKDNYDILSRGRSLGEYFGFVKATYPQPLAKLIAHWDVQMKQGEEEAEAKQEEEKREAEQIIKEAEEREKAEKEREESQKPIDIIIPSIIPDTLRKTEEKIVPQIQEKVDEGVESIITDETVQQVGKGFDDIQNTYDEIANNPVDGIKNLIKSIKDRPKLTKEEKEAAKEEKKRQKEIEKIRKNREKAVQDSIRSVEKARQDSIENIEKEKIEFEKAAVRAKEDARKAATKAKEDARKAREQELKDKERARNEELKRKEQERNQRLKEKERERKEKERQREAQLREKEKQAREKRRSR